MPVANEVHAGPDVGGIVERISVVQRGADSWRGMNIARHVSDGPCSDAELGSLIAELITLEQASDAVAALAHGKQPDAIKVIIRFE